MEISSCEDVFVVIVEETKMDVTTTTRGVLEGFGHKGDRLVLLIGYVLADQFEQHMVVSHFDGVVIFYVDLVLRSPCLPLARLHVHPAYFQLSSDLSDQFLVPVSDQQVVVLSPLHSHSHLFIFLLLILLVVLLENKHF